MTMIYSNPAREQEAGAVPDVEVWEHHHPLTIGGKGTRFCEPTVAVFDEQGKCRGAGWYWQPAVPGLMADGGPGAHGPFDTEAEAIADAQFDDASEQDYEQMTAGDAIETDDEAMDDEPGDEDYYLSDDERSIYHLGKRIIGPVDADAEPSPRDAVMARLANNMAGCVEHGDCDHSGYFPNVWKVSDHGNPILISVQECGCYFTEHIGKPCDREVKAANEIADSILPPCILAMRCYCAGHARGNPASEPCDTNEHASSGTFNCATCGTEFTESNPCVNSYATYPDGSTDDGECRDCASERQGMQRARKGEVQS